MIIVPVERDLRELIARPVDQTQSVRGRMQIAALGQCLLKKTADVPFQMRHKWRSWKLRPLSLDTVLVGFAQLIGIILDVLAV